jgi:hypothetical protein
MNGAGSWFPGPGGAAGPGGSPGANADGGGTGPGGPNGSVRAPGGPGAIGTGVPGTSGGAMPGRPAIGIPGVGGRPLGFGGDDATSGKTGYGPLGPKGPCSWLTPAQGIGLPGRGSSSGGGAYEHGEPGATAGPG